MANRWRIDGSFFQQLSDHPAVFKDPTDPKSRGQHFLDHAMQLWFEGGHLPGLTPVQAGQHLAFV